MKVHLPRHWRAPKAHPLPASKNVGGNFDWKCRICKKHYPDFDHPAHEPRYCTCGGVLDWTPVRRQAGPQ